MIRFYLIHHPLLNNPHQPPPTSTTHLYKEMLAKHRRFLALDALNVPLPGHGHIFRSSKDANLETNHDSLLQLVAELRFFEVIHSCQKTNKCLPWIDLQLYRIGKYLEKIITQQNSYKETRDWCLNWRLLMTYKCSPKTEEAPLNGIGGCQKSMTLTPNVWCDNHVGWNWYHLCNLFCGCVNGTSIYSMHAGESGAAGDKQAYF